jgi:hypothetical protein
MQQVLKRLAILVVFVIAILVFSRPVRVDSFVLTVWTGDRAFRWSCRP